MREVTFSNGWRCVIGPSWCVTTTPDGREVHAHPTDDQAETAESLGYGDDLAGLTTDHDPLHVWLCDALGLPGSFALSEAAGAPSDPELAALEEAAVIAVQHFMKRAGGRPPF